ncbi:MAG: hypothetical protein K6A44_02560 [bacterium]|nr:hypothetical protein [bacterium]
MRIIEIKSQNITILYKPVEDKIAVGDFVDFSEGSIGLVAQVFRIFSGDNAGEYNQAELKVLLTLKYGKAFSWNGETVSVDAKVRKTSCEFIENYINKGDLEDAFALGYSAGTYNQPLRLSFCNFTTPAFVGYENRSDNESFMKTVAHQFQFYGRKLLIIDYNGNIEIEGAKRVTAGFQMKLPLNAEMLENLSSKMTLGVSADAKAVIEEVLMDLARFARETTDFISISKLINVIDETYRKSKISQLILFKNKLRVFQRQSIFADDINEINSVYDAILTNNIVIFDISNIPEDWKKEFLNRAIYSPENTLKNYYLYMPIEPDMDNKLLNYLLFKANKDGIRAILAANYRYIAMDKILDFSANSFLFHSASALDKREYLSDIIQSLPQDYFVVTGNLTSSLNVVSYLGEPIEILDSEIIRGQNTENNETLDIIQKNIDENAFEVPQEQPLPTADVDMNAINTALDSSSQNVSAPPEEQPVVEEALPEEIPTEEAAVENTVEEEPVAEIPVAEEQIAEVIEEPISDDVESNVAEVVEEPIEEAPQQEEVQLLTPDETPPVNDTEISIEEDDFLDEDDKLVHRDILDASYDTIAEEPAPANEEIELDDLDFLDDVQSEQQPYTQNDEDELLDLLSETDDAQGVENISVDDLDFEEANPPQQYVEPQQKLPVYEAEYTEKKPSNALALQEGDLVKHNKYGLGTVKKLINHGNKIMCFINFEDFGRRLLDPEISQLEKIK